MSKKKGCSAVLVEEKLEAEASPRDTYFAVKPFPISKGVLVSSLATREKRCSGCHATVRVPGEKNLYLWKEKTFLCPNCTKSINY